MAKVAKNLLLDVEAVERGERYSTLHDTTLSKLVSDFLAGLPVDAAEEALPPAVRRLIGIGVPKDGSPAADVSDHREHLWRKHGGSTTEGAP